MDKRKTKHATSSTRKRLHDILGNMKIILQISKVIKEILSLFW